MKDISIKIEEPILEQYRSDHNDMIRRTIGMMMMKNTEDAVITAKLHIHIDKMNIPDNGMSREAPCPSFKHEISSVMQVKDKMSGQSKGEYELIFDEDGNPMYRNISNGQTSMFDDDETITDRDAQSLLTNGVRGIPEKATVHEAEYSESEDTDDAPADDADESVETEDNDEDVETEDSGEEDGLSEGPYKWLLGFRDHALYVQQNAEVYTVRDKESNAVILSTAGDASDVFHVDPWKLQKHVGHNLICVASPETADGNDIEAIEIWCDDCGDFIFTLRNPNCANGSPNEISAGSDDGYSYDEPEE